MFKFKDIYLYKLIIPVYYFTFDYIIIQSSWSMYTIQENIKPIADLYDQWLNGFYLSGLLQFKAQR
jgi:hypothetical protein